MTENEPLKRRDVLKATAATIGAGVGATGAAAASDVGTEKFYAIGDCVDALTDTTGYYNCPGENPAASIPEGWKGTVTDNCVDAYNNYWVEVEWECDERWVVKTGDVGYSSGCC